jgi:hypothetical protein
MVQRGRLQKSFRRTRLAELHLYGYKIKMRICNPFSEFPVALIGSIPDCHISDPSTSASIRTDMSETSEQREQTTGCKNLQHGRKDLKL